VGKKAARGLLGSSDFEKAEAVADKNVFEVE
jgi:hypothetical protein